MKIRITELESPPHPLAEAVRSGRITSSVRVARNLDDIELPEDVFGLSARADLAKRLEEGIAPYRPPVAALDSARALARAGTFVVSTGATAGALGGPLSNIARAVHVVRLSRSLTQAWETTVVPVFWVRSDDVREDDFAAWFVNENLDLQSIALEPRSDSLDARSPLCEPEVPLRAARALLSQAFAGAAGLDEALELLLPRDGESLADAFARGLLELFGDKGLVVAFPGDFRPELARALAARLHAGLDQRIIRACEDLRDSGLDSECDPRKIELLFRTEDPARPLCVGGEGFRFSGEPGSRTPDELAAQVIEQPTRWSYGRHLSSILERALLPHASTTGTNWSVEWTMGSHERGSALAWVPSLALTCVDPATAASLTTLGLGPGALPEEPAETPLDEEPASEARAGALLSDKLRRLTSDLGQALAELRREVSELDVRLVPGLRRTSRKVRAELLLLTDKLERSAANKAGGQSRHERRAQAWTRPLGRRQDEVLSPFPFLARFGRGWIDELLEATPAIARSDLWVEVLGD